MLWWQMWSWQQMSYKGESMEEEVLFPTSDVPDVEEQEEEYDTEYKQSVAWDIEKGDFVLDGANKMVFCSGQEAFKTWCYKTAMTERYSCLAYGDEIGAEMEDATEEDEQEAVELEIERTITEALMVNPRTEYVRDFSFSWNADEVICTFIVKGIEQEEEFEVTI